LNIKYNQIEIGFREQLPKSLKFLEGSKKLKILLFDYEMVERRSADNTE